MSPGKRGRARKRASSARRRSGWHDAQPPPPPGPVTITYPDGTVVVVPADGGRK